MSKPVENPSRDPGLPEGKPYRERISTVLPNGALAAFQRFDQRCSSPLAFAWLAQRKPDPDPPSSREDVPSAP